VINATPVGMAADDDLPAPIGRLDPGTIVFDIVPKPAVTRLMAYAKEAGCQVIGGASMIEAQADAILEFLDVGTANGDREWTRIGDANGRETKSGRAWTEWT
jgi:shikimate dehydrogenase